MFDLRESIKMAGAAARDAVKMVTDDLGVVQPKSKVLSPQEQVHRFMGMTQRDFLRLKEKYGDDAFNRYLTRMMQLSKEV
jgi:hypothetical protein